MTQLVISRLTAEKEYKNKWMTSQERWNAPLAQNNEGEEKKK